MFVDSDRFETDSAYRAARHAEVQEMLQSSADRAGAAFSALDRALQARGLTTDLVHTGGGVFNLAIDLDLFAQERDLEGWRLLIGLPERGEVGNITWEASVEDEEGTLDAITITLTQLPEESVEAMADQLAKFVARMGAEPRSP